MSMHPNDRECTDEDWAKQCEDTAEYFRYQDEQDGVEHHMWEG